ncbi:MAG: delta-60 repeat domain-containing protein, partial [Chitinophagaceae bacterium]|nr:delta-60 repeat domain-containing protein [Chitinophagaceae bacterium]
MKRLYAIFFSLISYTSVVAQMGVLDASFVTGTGANNIVYTSNLQTDGKVIIGGIFNNYNGTTGQNRIARLNTDGSLDATFTIGTGANQTIISSEIQPADGKILIGGNFTSYNGTARSR